MWIAFDKKLRSLKLFNEMPDIGSSQTVQESPHLNGNVSQNGEKYPDKEVSDRRSRLTKSIASSAPGNYAEHR